ncbi:MAG TPA: ethanolamine ammonia-lyase subunit EutC [Ideonella sp.]|uniref:ethanolamine ammonia-lyase subunit EutC n=1 Tax=Ideonella sp. TaxID=1929293 RepID=UPI002E318DD6|nr:ethanolamine ammonia-lyase subunit EutC [Ideonella sp.]HEX5686323.1 ethanolamine ammonia-lyase subunit EutC [Ideonella sp.]
MKPPVISNPWASLRRFTPARIALGRSGTSLPTEPQLAFQLAHAQARDAVHRTFDVDGTALAMHALGLATRMAHSAAADRPTYLQRPDRGRSLDGASAAALRATTTGSDLALVVADGLSALAVERHAAPFMAALLPLLRSANPPWSLSPIVLVQQGRVAIGDEIGALLQASMVLVMIGERPGLSSPDSLGLYLTWAPRPGRTDAERNCVSNVRPEGLLYDDAAHRAAWLLNAARARQLTGVALKDESEAPPALASTAAPGFVLTDGSRR